MTGNNDGMSLCLDPIVGSEGRPKIECHFKVSCNPNVDDVQRRTIEWAARMKLIQEFSAMRTSLCSSRFALLAGIAYPSVTKAQVQVASDFITFLFVYDDMCDALLSKNSTHESTFRVIEDRLAQVGLGGPVQENDHPLVLSLADVCQRLFKFGHPSWRERFGLSMREQFNAARWERLLRVEGRPPTFSTFKFLRENASGVRPCLDLSGMFLKGGSSTDLLNCVYIQHLLTMAINHVAWANDVISLSKERGEAVASNLVVVLAQRRELTWPGAMDLAIEMVNGELAAFEDLENKIQVLRGLLESDTFDFIASMKSWMKGNLDWSKESGRYST